MGIDVSIAVHDDDDRAYLVEASVDLGRPASFRGHPDNWEPADPGEVEVTRVTLDGQELDERALEAVIARDRLEERLVEAAEEQARRLDREHEDDRADYCADREADRWMEGE